MDAATVEQAEAEFELALKGLLCEEQTAVEEPPRRRREPAAERAADPVTREDRERRGAAAGGVRSAVVFAIGNLVMHDLLGEAVVRAAARPDGHVSIEWKRKMGRFVNSFAARTTGRSKSSAS